MHALAYGYRGTHDHDRLFGNSMANALHKRGPINGGGDSFAGKNPKHLDVSHAFSHQLGLRRIITGIRTGLS